MKLELSNLVEKDITSNWKYKDRVYVSVICTAYNHDKYISQALDSFLSQITKYRFEIVIHDDASCDHTKEILQRYKTRFPNIINLILQSENQYNIKPNLPFHHCLSSSRGEYIALCEGDDYWLSTSKLEKQVELLNSHINVDFCFHPSKVLYSDNSIATKKSKFSPLYVKDKDLLATCSSHVPTNSMFIRRLALEKLPRWFWDTADIGDFYLQCYASKRGGGIYLDEFMSVYRVFSDGSWSSKGAQNRKKLTRRSINIKKCYSQLLIDFPGNENSIKSSLAREYFHLYLKSLDLELPNYANYFSKQSFYNSSGAEKIKFFFYHTLTLLGFSKSIVAVLKLRYWKFNQ